MFLFVNTLYKSIADFVYYTQGYCAIVAYMIDYAYDSISI